MSNVNSRGRGNRRNFGQKGRGISPLDGKINKLIPMKLTKVRIICENTFEVSNDIPAYSLEIFMKMKETLNAKKSEMDKLFIDKKLAPEFAKLTNAIRITNNLRFVMQREYNGQNVTRAWLKFYELFVHFGLVEKAALIDKNGKKSLKIFFNAELPGAGVCATNHLMKTYYSNIDYDWVASSLVLGKSNDERIGARGDQYGIWKNNKEKWLMDVSIEESGGDAVFKNNGDVTNIENILDMKKKIGTELPRIYTHDAGIDVSSAFEELEEQTGFNTQEYKNAKIHFGCAVAALETLDIGGCFIAKQYTFFETFTINLILIYANMFEEFYICKPMTSGQSNSEIYLVGINFTGYKPEYRNVFSERMKNWNVNPFIEEKDLRGCENALGEIARYARARNTEQIQYIDESLKIFDIALNKKSGTINSDEIKNYMAGISSTFTRNWIKLYVPRRIDTSDYVAAAT